MPRSSLTVALHVFSLLSSGSRSTKQSDMQMGDNYKEVGSPLVDGSIVWSTDFRCFLELKDNTLSLSYQTHENTTLKTLAAGHGSIGTNNFCRCGSRCVHIAHSNNCGGSVSIGSHDDVCLIRLVEPGDITTVLKVPLANNPNHNKLDCLGEQPKWCQDPQDSVWDTEDSWNPSVCRLVLENNGRKLKFTHWKAGTLTQVMSWNVPSGDRKVVHGHFMTGGRCGSGISFRCWKGGQTVGIVRVKAEPEACKIELVKDSSVIATGTWAI